METLSAEERMATANALHFRLGFCLHDEDGDAVTEAEWNDIEQEYYLQARVFYLITGTDFRCGHGEVTKNGIPSN